jgi:hypothetical protein
VLPPSQRFKHLWPQKDREAAAQANGGNVKQKQLALELAGWRTWLTTLFPFAFDSAFSDDHALFWNQYWSVLLRIRENLAALSKNQPPPHFIPTSELVILYILGRALGKSASVEPSAVMRGALLHGGYSLFISESDDQAQEHLGNTRILIDHPDSRLLEYYPDMAVTDEPLRGLPALDRRELFITRCGWIARAKGLKAKMRGLRVGTRRPDDLNIDDIDDINDGIDLSVKKLKVLKASILPVQSKQWTTIKFTQNLILEQGVMNQIYTGRSDALAERTTIGPTKTFTQFDYETVFDTSDGRNKHRILPTSKTSWVGVSLAEAQKFLSDSGLATFKAEYQNDFEAAREGRVLRNYNDSLMVITKSQFALVFNSREIPDNWNKYMAHDWSRTKSEYHACVAGSLAISSQNTPLPGKLFLFNLLSFDEGAQADTVAQRMLKTISPDYNWDGVLDASLSRAGLEAYIKDITQLMVARRETLAQVLPPIVQPIISSLHYQRFTGSHEQNNDALQVYRNVYGLPFQPKNPGTTGGLEWADHYMTVDHSRPHPFKDDALINGKWEHGCPGIFLVVDDDKAEYPKAPIPDQLTDSDLWRYQFNNWLMQPLKVTEGGVIEHGPMKMNDDCGQALQQLLDGNRIQAAPLTTKEMVAEVIPPRYRPEAMRAATGSLTPEQELSYEFQLARAKKIVGRTGIVEFNDRLERVGNDDDADEWG